MAGVSWYDIQEICAGEKSPRLQRGGDMQQQELDGRGTSDIRVMETMTKRRAMARRSCCGGIGRVGRRREPDQNPFDPPNRIADGQNVMNQVYAAIFDMDGVLVDTYQAHYRSWLELARAEGLDFSEEDFAQTFGWTSREVIAKLWAGSFSAARVAAMDAEKEAAFRRASRGRPAMPGAVACCNRFATKASAWPSGRRPPENVNLVLVWRNLRDCSTRS